MHDSNLVCKHGLSDVWINYKSGDVRMCGWTGYFLGSLLEHSFEELWNSEKAELFRQSLLDGSYRFCNKAKCPYCANEQLEEHLTEYNVPEYPAFCSLSYQLQCNYACRFCRDQIYKPAPGEVEGYAVIEHEIQKLIPHLREIGSNGAGEFFCSQSILRLLKNTSFSPNLKFFLETNGSLFNQKNWEPLRQLGDLDLTVFVTVHSFNERTYQYLSGTKLPVQTIIDNLHFISSLRNQSVINDFTIATVICERNFREMPDFVHKCLNDYSMDHIRLRFFEPYSVMDRLTEWFYDIRNPYHPYHDEFLDIMNDPVFEDPRVWKWQGETATLQGESPYVSERKNVRNLSDILLSKITKESIKTWLNNNGFRSVALYGASDLGFVYKNLLHDIGLQITIIFDTFSCYEKQGVHVIHPDHNNVNQFDLIIITNNTYAIEIKEHLFRLNYKGTVLSMDDFICNVSSQKPLL